MYGTCCQLVYYKGVHKNVGCGPDYIRLRNRYENLNGVSTPDDTNLKMRAMSYLMMIGDSNRVRQIITNKNFPIKPIPWYDTPLL